MNAIKGLVRPIVTGGLVAAFIAAAFYDKDAAALIGGPMGIALGFWFKDRELSAE